VVVFGSNPATMSSKDAVIAVFKEHTAPIVAYPLIGWTLEGRTDLGDLIVDPILGPSLLRLAQTDLTFPTHLRCAIVSQMDSLMLTRPGANLVTIFFARTDLTSNEWLSLTMKLSCGFMGKYYVD